MTVKRTLFWSMIISLLGFSFSFMTPSIPREVTYTVNSDTDVIDANPGDGICATTGGNCTLHAAIQEANLDGQASTILFASKFQDTHTINGCTLPALTESYTKIDGSNRWDNVIKRPGVEIHGSSCNVLTINSNNNTILGILFAGGDSTGIYLQTGDSNIIGGYSEGQRNVFLTSQHGVSLHSGSHNSVYNNYFGTATGDTIPGLIAGEYGIFAETQNTEIADNLIVGYSLAGIRLYYSDNNVITDNIIGLDSGKQLSLGNEIGIDIGWSDFNTIGPNNVIAGNKSHGITTSQVDNTTISGNMIGYPWSTVSIGNGGDGIHLHAATNSIINSTNIIDSNSGNGIWLDFENVTIQGNLISSNEMDGIYIEGNNSQIGGSTSQERNVIESNTGSGIHLVGANNITIFGNYIGLESAGAFDYGNKEFGILVEGGSSNNVIGGKGGNGNLIAYNDKTGIQIEGATTMNNQVLGNVLGSPIHWAWPAGNGQHGIGIYDGAHDNQIGTTEFGNSNIVLASGWSGIVIVNSSNNSVVGNHIGTDGDSINWGNNYYGVNVVGNSIANIISNNEIAYNGSTDRLDEEEAGIKIDYAWSITISQNSIHDNDGPGIQLVNGGNIDLPAPVISQASCTEGVSGTAGGLGWIIEIFSDGSDEGRIYEGKAISDGSGWVWNGKPSGPNLTATARAQANDTSQFSIPFNIGICDKYIYLPLLMKNFP